MRLLGSLLILAGLLALVPGQMFQYSRGWRPGKRADDSTTPSELPAGGSPMFSLVVRCLQAINAWEGLHAASEPAEVGRAASHLLDVLEHCQIKDGYWAP